MSNEETSEKLQGSIKNNIAESSVPSNGDTVRNASISPVTRDGGMMAIHQTHSAGAHQISGSPNTIDSHQSTTNSCPDARTDSEFHPMINRQRSNVHHVSNHIRTNPAMPPVSTEQLPATLHKEQEIASDQETDTSTIQSSTTDNRNDQQQKMCLGAPNMKPSGTMTGAGCGGSGGGSTSGGGRSEPDDRSETSSKASASSRRKRPIKVKKGQTLGRWTPEEHQAFLQGLKVFGREWKKVAERIPTRTSAQIRSHAQKYFAKIQREESIMMQDAAVAATQLASQPYNNPIPEAAEPSQVPPTVQRNVERILANPTDLQREVEDTMRELRERYQQLQIRLAETNRRRHGAPPPRGRVVEDEPDRRKRPLEEVTHHNDDISSVSSTVSGYTYTRELGDEELIALSVLGATLPRSASNQDLHRAASNDDGSQHSARSENSSPTSTIASHRQNSQAGESEGEKTKKRKVADEEPPNDTNVDDGSTNTQGDMAL